MAGGALLSASLQYLLDRMVSQQVLSFLRGQKLGPTLLKKMKIQLLAFQAVIDDAEAQQFAKPAVKYWVAELKHALYDAEDLLDDITTEALRCKMESDSTHPDQVRNFIQSRVEKITEALEDLAEEKDALGLKQGVVGEILSRRRTKTSLVDESGVYGRQDDINKIVDLLSSSDIGSCGNNKVSVISLVGMGGVGKTTLAQLVYKHRRVVDCFDLREWVCVSEEFDLVRITKTILQAITSEKQSCDDSDLNLLQCKLEENLSKKKFLLILDDVWNEKYNDLEKLQLPFNAGRPGSKIVVTTRSGEVARIMRSVNIHVGELPFQDCWSLFAKRAFEHGDSSPYPRLGEIGKEIVKKCKGLPLAVKTLGAALYSELEVKQWENVLNSKAWDLPNDEILPALRLSYSFLRPQLKRCFAYCSIFPKDYEFEKENLILLWMAEGFLQETNGMRTMEEIGDMYFRELFTKSFFQKSSINESYFVMHDLINDLAQLVSMSFSTQLKDGKMNEVEKEVRHLSYFPRQSDHFERFETLNEVSGLRTFLPLHLITLPRLDKVSELRSPDTPYYGLEFSLSNKVCSDILPKVQYLRVLSLCYYEIPDLPHSIGNLKHLRYLDLTYAAITRLPDSICCLYNLQTLILYNCRRLVELPQMMSKMISLRHLDIRQSAVKQMPSEMGQLKGLRKLSNYIVGKQSGDSVGELRELCHIGGSLVIQELQNVFDAKDALEANLVGKQYLDELELEWGRAGRGFDQSGAEAVLNNLKPHSELKRLTIHRYGGSIFPNWLGGGGPGSLLNMVSLRLWRCENVSAFPPLGQLPLLEHLYIDGLEGIERVDTEFYGTDPSSFVSLKALSFQRMSKWKEWMCLGELFPRLEELYIEDCPVLTEDLPVHLPLLTKLQISGCEQLVAPLPRVPAIRELTSPYRNMSWWKELPPQLHSLCIQNLDSLESLSEKGTFHGNTSLDSLTLINCYFSEPLQHKICLPLTLKSFSVGGKKLEFLLSELSKCHLPSLRELGIIEGTDDSLLSIPLGNFPRLRSLIIHDREGLEFLSVSISDGNFPSIDWLSIQSCPNLVSICFKNMKEDACFKALFLSYCPELIFPIQGLHSTLTTLGIFDCNKLFTSQMEFGLPSLTHLYISNILNLKSLDGMGLHLLTSLQELKISNCPNLQSLTDEPLPTSLSFLRIENCPLLEDRCKFWTGEYWPLISHIQGIVINDQVIDPCVPLDKWPWPPAAHLSPKISDIHKCPFAERSLQVLGR